MLFDLPLCSWSSAAGTRGIYAISYRTVMCPAAEDSAEVAPGDFNCNKSAHTAHRYWEEIGLQNLASKQRIQRAGATFLDIHHCHMLRRLHESDHSMSWPRPARLPAPRNGSNMTDVSQHPASTSWTLQKNRSQHEGDMVETGDSVETQWRLSGDSVETLLLQHIIAHRPTVQPSFQAVPQIVCFQFSRFLENTTSRGNPLRICNLDSIIYLKKRTMT